MHLHLLPDARVLNSVWVVVIESDGVRCDGRGPFALPLCVCVCGCVQLCRVARRPVECQRALPPPLWRGRPAQVGPAEWVPGASWGKAGINEVRSGVGVCVSA